MYVSAVRNGSYGALTLHSPVVTDCVYHLPHLRNILTQRKGKAVPVTGRGGPQGCETSRLPHFLDKQLTVGGAVVSLTRRPPFTPRNIPGTHFC
jgi:hypothetical protein